MFANKFLNNNNNNNNQLDCIGPLILNEWRKSYDIVTNTLIMTCGGSECYSIILFHYILTYGRLTIQLIGKMFIKLVEKP